MVIKWEVNGEVRVMRVSEFSLVTEKGQVLFEAEEVQSGADIDLFCDFTFVRKADYDDSDLIRIKLIKD